MRIEGIGRGPETRYGWVWWCLTRQMAQRTAATSVEAIQTTTKPGGGANWKAPVRMMRSAIPEMALETMAMRRTSFTILLFYGEKAEEALCELWPRR